MHRTRRHVCKNSKLKICRFFSLHPCYVSTSANNFIQIFNRKSFPVFLTGRRRRADFYQKKAAFRIKVMLPVTAKIKIISKNQNARLPLKAFFME